MTSLMALQCQIVNRQPTSTSNNNESRPYFLRFVLPSELASDFAKPQFVENGPTLQTVDGRNTSNSSEQAAKQELMADKRARVSVEAGESRSAKLARFISGLRIVQAKSWISPNLHYQSDALIAPKRSDLVGMTTLRVSAILQSIFGLIRPTVQKC